MLRFSRAAFLALGLFALSGCAEQWAKPGATPQDFDAAQSSCQSQAMLRFPPVMQPLELQPGYTTPIVTHCSGTPPYSYTCVQQGGEYVQPTVVGVDTNTDARDNDVRSCLYQNGWKPVD